MAAKKSYYFKKFKTEGKNRIRMIFSSLTRLNLRLHKKTIPLGKPHRCTITTKKWVWTMLIHRWIMMWFKNWPWNKGCNFASNNGVAIVRETLFCVMEENAFWPHDSLQEKELTVVTKCFSGFILQLLLCVDAVQGITNGSKANSTSTLRGSRASITHPQNSGFLYPKLAMVHWLILMYFGYKSATSVIKVPDVMEVPGYPVP